MLEQTGSEGALSPPECPSESLREGQRKAGPRKRPHFLRTAPNAKAAGASCQLLPLSQPWEMGPLPGRPLFSIPSEGWACGECFVDSAQQLALLFYLEVGGPGRKALPPGAPASMEQRASSQRPGGCSQGSLPSRQVPQEEPDNLRPREGEGGNLALPTTRILLGDVTGHHQGVKSLGTPNSDPVGVLCVERYAGETRPPAARLGHLGFGLLGLQSVSSLETYSAGQEHLEEGRLAT